MSHPSKQKGNRFEREIVDKAKDRGLDAKRAWLSICPEKSPSNILPVLLAPVNPGARPTMHKYALSLGKGISSNVNAFSTH